MFRGFDVELVLNKKSIDDYFAIGNSIYENHSHKFKDKLFEFLCEDNKLNGTAIRDAWFPQIEADIFISHSHKDVKQAIALAGWLKEEFGLKAFVDSCIWQHADFLQKRIDNAYCKKEDGSYDYDKRNYTTSHIHMMLSSALSLMIDRTECIFFLNTPNSVNIVNGLETTESPWLFSEIATTQFIRVNEPKRISDINEGFENFTGPEDLIKGQKNFSIIHNIDLGHLCKIDIEDLIKWQKAFSVSRKHPLDLFYIFHPAKHNK